MRSKLFIIIPIFNRFSFTEKCINSLATQTSTNCKILIIDDGSTDNSSALLASRFKQLIIKRFKGNLYWAESTNQGVYYALSNGADYILTLNNDTIPTDTFVVDLLNETINHPDALFGAHAIDIKTKKSVYIGERINWLTAKYQRCMDFISLDSPNRLVPVTHLPGRGLLIPAKVFHTIGFFDSIHFPQSGADDDFTFRAARAGFDIFCNLDAKLYIYPEESGDAWFRRNKSLKNYYNHLFHLKGGGNLKRFWFLAWRNCPKRYLSSFIICGIARRLFGYLLEWLRESFHANKFHTDSK